MNRYDNKELIRFLRKTDQYLNTRCNLVVIGGAAASFAHGATRTTTDIDVINQLPEYLEEAFEKARLDTGITIPVSFVAVYEAPYEFEERLQKFDEYPFQNLNIFVPERHDLALMKITRGYENDIQAIMEMHQHLAFNKEVMVDRFMNEMTHILGNHRMIRLSFVATIEALFGEVSAAEVEEITQNWSPLQLLN